MSQVTDHMPFDLIDLLMLHSQVAACIEGGRPVPEQLLNRLVQRVPMATREIVRLRETLRKKREAAGTPYFSQPATR